MIPSDQEKLNRLIQEVTSLRAVATACVEEVDEGRLIERVTATMSEAFQISNFGVILLGEGSDILSDHASYLLAPGGKSLSHRLGEGIVGTVAQSGLPMRVPYVKKEPLYREGDPETRSELCVPLLFGGQVLGVINAESPTVNAFSEADEHLLVTLAGLLAPALMRSRYAVEVRDSARQYRSLYDDLPSMYFTLDTEGTVLSVNRFGLQQLGYAADDLVGEPVTKIFHEGDREAVGHQLAQLLRDPGGVAHWEFRKIRKDGSLLWVKESARAIPGDGGQPVVLVVCEDITDRKEAELALCESQEKYRSIFDNALEGMFQTTVLGEVVSANPALAYILGYANAEEMIGGITDVGEQLYADPSVRASYVERVIAEGAVLGFETQLLRKDGSRFWASLSTRAVYDEEGKVEHLEGSVVDVTERMRAEEETSRIRQLLVNIVDSMPSVLVGVDPEGRITEWNCSAEHLTGVPADDAKGQLLEEVFPWLASQAGQVGGEAESKGPRKVEKALLDVENEKRYADVMIYPLVANGVGGAVIRLDDVTDRVKMEQLVVQTEKIMSVGGIAAGVAHEINNPLGGVLQGAQNILRRLDPDLPQNVKAAKECGCDLETIRAYLEKRQVLQLLQGVRESGERAAKIVSEMLQFTRPSTLQMLPARLTNCLDRMVALAMTDYDLKRQYDFRKIEIVREYDPGLGEVPCISSQIDLVIFNMLKNAAQAMHKDRDRAKAIPPRIVLRALRDGDRARIEVEDNGPGMDESARERLFEPGEASGPEAETGLGLSVSSYIIKDVHKGELSVESAPGGGTKFVLRIPLERSEA